MWIVRLALRRPYTFAVFALLLMIVGLVSILNTPVDVFPYIDIPVISIVWQYAGLSPQDMANRIVTNAERGLTTSVDNIDHLESESLNGKAVIHVYFQPFVNIATAMAEITANSQATIALAAPRYDPSSDPQVRCIERAYPATWSFRARSFRAGAQ